MVKYTQTIRRQYADELFSVFDHFIKLVLKGLIIFWLNGMELLLFHY